MSSIELSSILSNMCSNSQAKVAVAVNNASNVSTIGFKGSELYTQDLYYDNTPNNLKFAQSSNNIEDNVFPNLLQVGKGADISSISRLHSQGQLKKTDRQFDFAIEKSGYFRIKLENGYGYTRAGHFHISSDGKSLLTDQGYTVDAEVNISRDDLRGDMFIDTQNNTLVGDNNKLLVKFNIYDFQNPEKLEAKGANIFTETESSGPYQLVNLTNPNGTKIKHEWLEYSNIEFAKILQDIRQSTEEYKLSMMILKYVNDMYAYSTN